MMPCKLVFRLTRTGEGSGSVPRQRVQTGQERREFGLTARSRFRKDRPELRSGGFAADGQSGARHADSLA